MDAVSEGICEGALRSASMEAGRLLLERKQRMKRRWWQSSRQRLD